MPKYQRQTKSSSDNHVVGQAEVVTMKTTGKPELIHEELEVIDGPAPDKDWIENTKNGEDILTVTVHTTPEKHSEPAPYFYNNGRRYIFPRGFPQQVPRKVVEQLARCKQTGYANVEYIDEEGNKAVKWPATTSLRYPFTVEHDPNPKMGPAWLRKILGER